MRQVLRAGIERDREPAGRVVETRNRLRDSLAAVAAWIPGLQDSHRMLLCPGVGDGASTQVDDNHGFACCGDAFEEPLLRSGQIDTGAISSSEAFYLDWHFFPLKLSREASESNDDVGVFCGCYGFIELWLCGRLTAESGASTGTIARVAVLDSNRVGFCVGQRHFYAHWSRP